MANPLLNHGVNFPDDEQVQPELVPALHGFAPAVSSRKVFAPGPIGKDVDILHRKVNGLAQQMFDRANTKYLETDTQETNKNVGNKMHKAFPLPVKVVATAKRLEMPLPEVCTAIEEKKKKLPVKDRWQLH
nr:hypothetical protein [Tanacetum cinerariifolium]